jgi:hydroxymethylglutaryl-CoA lyase
MAAGRGSDRRLTIGLANSFHCVTEGRIDPDRVMAVVAELAGFGIVDISLCDTTGHATPDHVFELCGRAIDAFPLVTFGAHLHDTRGRGIVNAVAALSAGIEWFDATLAGLGGSPFSPGAGGNLSLEAFAETLEAMGVETGIDVDRISRTGAEIGSHLGLGGARPV